MKLTAKSDKELGACLKMLYNEGLNDLPIDLDKDENGKIYFNVIFSVDEDRFSSIQKKYEILIAE